MTEAKIENFMEQLAGILDEGYKTDGAKIVASLIGVTRVLVEARNFLDSIESYVISIDGKLDEIVKKERKKR